MKKQNNPIPAIHIPAYFRLLFSQKKEKRKIVANAKSNSFYAPNKFTLLQSLWVWICVVNPKQSTNFNTDSINKNFLPSTGQQTERECGENVRMKERTRQRWEQQIENSHLMWQFESGESPLGGIRAMPSMRERARKRHKIKERKQNINGILFVLTCALCCSLLMVLHRTPFYYSLFKSEIFGSGAFLCTVSALVGLLLFRSKLCPITFQAHSNMI